MTFKIFCTVLALGFTSHTSAQKQLWLRSETPDDPRSWVELDPHGLRLGADHQKGVTEAGLVFKKSVKGWVLEFPNSEPVWLPSNREHGRFKIDGVSYRWKITSI